MITPYLFVVKHPRTVVTICVVLTILSCVQLAVRRVKLDGSPETLIIKSDQSAIFYNETLFNIHSRHSQVQQCVWYIEASSSSSSQ